MRSSQVLMVLAACAVAGHGQLIGVDFGSEFIKVAGIKPGVGSTGIDVILNEQSKRKSNNYIGFRGEDRFFGEDAHNLAPRFPDQMYTFINRLAGLRWEDEEARTMFTKKWNLPYNLVKNANRSTIDILHSDPPIEFTAEELLAQLFSYIKGQSEKHMETNTISGAVVTVPDFFTVDQRQAIVSAANLTGLPIIGLMENTLAAALQYGVQRRGKFEEEEHHLVVYDMGSSKTEVGVYRFTKPIMEKGKPKRGGELGHLVQLAVTTDATLGGRTIDARLANFLAKKFEEKTGINLLGATDKPALKAMTVLMKAAKKAKEVLSANKEAPVAVEELYDGKPFFYTLKRAELDQECDDLFQRATPPLTKALELAGVNIANVSQVEIIGGGIRIPRLQAALSDSLGGRNLDKTLNGDECMCLGATLQAARLSKNSPFRVMGFTIVDHVPYNVTFKLSKKPGSDKEPKMRPLFSSSPFGAKKSITVARQEDFDVNLYLQTTNEKGEEVHNLHRTYHVKNVAPALESFGFNKEGKNESNIHSVQVVVELTQAGLLEVEDVTVKYDEHVMVTKKIKIKEPKVNATEAGDKKKEGEEEKKEEKEEKKEDEKKEEEKKEEKEEEKEEKKEDEKKEEGKEGEEKKEEQKKPEEPKYKFVNRTEVKKHRVKVPAETTEVIPPPMDNDSYNRSLEILEELQKIDDLKKEAAAAKNDLETYLYWVKYEGILDNEAMEEFITEEEREKLNTEMEELNDWVEYGEGSEESTKASAFTDKRLKLKESVKKITDKKKAKEDAELKAKKDAEEAEAAAKKEAEEKAKKEAEEKESETEDKQKEEEDKEDAGKEKEGDEDETKEEL